jgi:hypothetical protein
MCPAACRQIMELEVQTLNLLSKNNSLVAYISGEEKVREQTRPVHLKKNMAGCIIFAFAVHKIVSRNA